MQIQFDNDFKKPGRGLALADSHRLVDTELLQHLRDRFAFLALHVPYKQMDLLDVHVPQLLRGLRTKEIFILVRDAPNTSAAELIPEHNWSKDPQVSMIHLPDLSSAGEPEQRKVVNTLRKLMLERIGPHLGYQKPTNSGAPGVFGRQSSISFTKSDLQILCGATTEGLDFAKQNLSSKDLTLMPTFSKLCELDRKLKSSQEDSAQVGKWTLERDQFKSDMKTASPSGSIVKFMDLLCDTDLDMLVEHKRLWESQDGSTWVTMMQEVFQLIGNENSHVSPDRRKRLLDVLAELVWRGEPIEVVDGDNLYLHSSILQQVSQRLTSRLNGKSLTVESTLGPQSSGKSTLKNRKYGCRFGVSEGRCTRGVWGQLVHMEDRVILVLDTEGLQSVEKSDPEFVTQLQLADCQASTVLVPSTRNQCASFVFVHGPSIWSKQTL